VVLVEAVMGRMEQTRCLPVLLTPEVAVVVLEQLDQQIQAAQAALE
jgi:hypothetical protein